MRRFFYEYTYTYVRVVGTRAYMQQLIIFYYRVRTLNITSSWQDVKMSVTWVVGYVLKGA